MRTYSNFLIFEDFLDYLPDSSTLLYHAADSIINPQVQVVEHDCGTLLGAKISLDYESEGLIESSTLNPLTQSRINYLLSQGTYSTFVRKTSHCTSEKGICQVCFQGTFPDLPVPAINDLVTLDALFNKYTDVIVGNGASKNFPLSKNPSDFEKVLVIRNGVLMTSGFSFQDDHMIFNVAPTLGTRTIVRFYELQTSSLLGFFTKTYSGGLLGIAELPTSDLIVRQSLLEDFLSDSFLDTMLNELSTISTVPSQYLDYCKEIHSKLEKALYIIYLYSVYDSIYS